MAQRKFTIEEKGNGELAVRYMSRKAQDFYNNTDPLTICEYSKDGLTLYAYSGCIGEGEGLTFEEIQEMLEEWAEMTGE